MSDKGQLDSTELQIQGLVEQYLKLGTAYEAVLQEDHLDGDTIAAFIEGNLNENESGPVNSHLVGCGFCRRKTAELVRLDLAFADEPPPAVTRESEPSKVADVLSGILGRIFGSGEGAVFAHQQDEEDTARDEEDENDPD